MNDLNDQYIAILSELSGEQENFLENIRQLHQQQRLWRQKHLEKSKSKRVKQEEEVWSIATIQQLKKGKSTKHNSKIREVALALQAAVRDAKHNSLSTYITLDKVMEGEIKV